MHITLVESVRIVEKVENEINSEKCVNIAFMLTKKN